jgi:hypothetical protein
MDVGTPHSSTPAKPEFPASPDDSGQLLLPIRQKYNNILGRRNQKILYIDIGTPFAPLLM